MTEHPKLAALAVVPHEGKLLLVRRKNEPDAGRWGYPGGHVDFGETAINTAVRELREETTVVAEPVAYLTNIDVIVKDAAGGVAHHFLLAAVLCRYQTGAPQPQDDVSNAHWFDFESVLGSKIHMSKDVDTVLRLALRRMDAG